MTPSTPRTPITAGRTRGREEKRDVIDSVLQKGPSPPSSRKECREQTRFVPPVSTRRAIKSTPAPSEDFGKNRPSNPHVAKTIRPKCRHGCKRRFSSAPTSCVLLLPPEAFSPCGSEGRDATINPSRPSGLRLSSAATDRENAGVEHRRGGGNEAFGLLFGGRPRPFQELLGAGLTAG